MKTISIVGTLKIRSLPLKQRIILLCGGKIENVPIMTVLEEKEYNRLVLEDERFIQMQDNLTKLVTITEKLMQNGNK